MHSSVVRNTPRGNSSGHHTPYDNRNTPLKTTTLPTATDPFASSFSSFINEAWAGVRTYVRFRECEWEDVRDGCAAFLVFRAGSARTLKQ